MKFFALAVVAYVTTDNVVPCSVMAHTLFFQDEVQWIFLRFQQIISESHQSNKRRRQPPAATTVTETQTSVGITKICWGQKMTLEK